MLRTNKKTADGVENAQSVNFWIQFRYQVILKYVAIKTTEAIQNISQMARCLSSISPKLC